MKQSNRNIIAFLPRPMPDLTSLMSEWPEDFEKALTIAEMPTAVLNCNLKEYVEIICAIMDIPVYGNCIESLHLLFSLYMEFKNSQTKAHKNTPMGLRFGARRPKEKQTDDKKTRKSSKTKNADKSKTLPPTGAGSANKSADKGCSESSIPSSVNTTASNNLYNSQSAGNRGVLFRDNRFPDGTAMPRIRTQQTQINPPGDDREGHASPTGSVYSSASIQPAFLSYASYPSSYVPQLSTKPVETTTRIREHSHSDTVYQSVYPEPLPKPDYPVSNDGTGNSNRDSGLDTESRSSSTGKPVKAGAIEEYSRWKGASHQGAARQGKGFQLQHFSHDMPNSVYNFSESPQILLPKNYPINRDTPDFVNFAFTMPSRRQKQLNTNGTTYGTSVIPRKRLNQKDLDEKAYRLRSANRQYRCSSSSCSEDVIRTSRSTMFLQRIQLDDGLTSEKRNYGPGSGRSGRPFRREAESEEYTARSVSCGLPRDQPLRGGYFEEKNEVDRYGRLPPVKRPVSRTPDRREAWGFVNEEDNEDVSEIGEKAEVDNSEEETSDSQDAPCYPSLSRGYHGRSRMQPDFLRQSSAPSMANRKISVIKL
ncbi:hypothetical protein EGR_08938 [Echinococcus granulosus]|uniref:Intraflagellar transport protein 46 homolog n=1 Tax=Echinococcus granulosus TaxID=6210 RepID=W6U4Z9_ECHGR|nr:hypothetical protein EGR_08938 [Echinococcus granulosus]EUB56190.1 hypothetical protein EGR_08938 [Echinococcus granulosus]